MGARLAIGKVAESTGLSPKAIRYYEAKGLLAPRPRTEGGYRQYEEADVRRLLFIRRAKELGISLRQISAFLACWPDGDCATTRPALRRILQERIETLGAQIALFRELRSQLERELSELDRRPTRTTGRATALAWGRFTRWLPSGGWAGGRQGKNDGGFSPGDSKEACHVLVLRMRRTPRLREREGHPSLGVEGEPEGEEGRIPATTGQEEVAMETKPRRDPRGEGAPPRFSFGSPGGGAGRGLCRGGGENEPL